MAWYNPFEKTAPTETVEKLNPGQQYIGNNVESSREYTTNYQHFYENLEIVNRAVNIMS